MLLKAPSGGKLSKVDKHFDWNILRVRKRDALPLRAGDATVRIPESPLENRLLLFALFATGYL